MIGKNVIKIEFIEISKSYMDSSLPIITIQNDNEAKLEYDSLLSFIDLYTHGSNFAIIMNFGLISTGKSTFSQSISGVKHEIGNGIKSKTKGAIISYCGKVSQLIKRFDIKEETNIDQNMHVFNIDSEGVLYDSKEKMVQYLFPLIKLSSALLVYTTSFTDLSIVPFLTVINHFTKKNILISICNSDSIIDPNIKSVSYYLNQASNSQIAEKLVSEKVKFEIIPCVDFGSKNPNCIQQKMNQYFISRILNLFTKKEWENASSYVHQLKDINAEYSSEFIQYMFTKKSVSESILHLIVNDCYSQIDQTIKQSDAIDLIVYDNLIIQITQKFNNMCLIANIDNEKIEKQKNKIINSLKLQKINAEFALSQQKMQNKIINDNTSKLEKEENMVEFLSNEISKMASFCILNLIGHIKNEDISKLKSLNSFFILKCNEIVFKSANIIRTEMIDHINDDINELAKSINQNCLSAIELIQKKIESRTKIKVELGVRVFGIVAALILSFTAKRNIGNLLCQILGVNSPFHLVSQPDERNFVINFRGQRYEASKDEIMNFCQNIQAQLGPLVMNLFDSMSHEIDPSIINSFPIKVEKRDYSQYLERLVNS